MESKVTEIAPDVFRISTFHPDYGTRSNCRRPFESIGEGHALHAIHRQHHAQDRSLGAKDSRVDARQFVSGRRSGSDLGSCVRNKRNVG